MSEYSTTQISKHFILRYIQHIVTTDYMAFIIILRFKTPFHNTKGYFRFLKYEIKWRIEGVCEYLPPSFESIKQTKILTFNEFYEFITDRNYAFLAKYPVH